MLQAPESRNVERNNTKRLTPIAIESAQATGSVVRITFNQVIYVKEGVIPDIRTDIAGADPISAVKTDPVTVEITYDAPVAAATTLIVEFQDGAIRNERGGFIQDRTFPL